MNRYLVISATTLLLAACGQKGALYLPESAEVIPVETSAIDAPATEQAVEQPTEVTGEPEAELESLE